MNHFLSIVLPWCHNVLRGPIKVNKMINDKNQTIAILTFNGSFFFAHVLVKYARIIETIPVTNVINARIL